VHFGWECTETGPETINSHMDSVHYGSGSVHSQPDSVHNDRECPESAVTSVHSLRDSVHWDPDSVHSGAPRINSRPIGGFRMRLSAAWQTALAIAISSNLAVQRPWEEPIMRPQRRSGPVMRKLEELINRTEPAWPLGLVPGRRRRGVLRGVSVAGVGSGRAGAGPVTELYDMQVTTPNERETL
jgi:hypothetical protein